MRRGKSPVVVLLLTIGALVLGQANESFASGLADGGRFMIKHSPILGINVGITVIIDGVEAGGFTKGHVYARYLTPGLHQLVVTRNGRGWDAWHATLNVQRGHTYAFIATYNVNQLVLRRVSRIPQ